MIKFNSRVVKGTLAVALAVSTAACTKNDGPENGRESNDVEFFIAAQESDNAAYLLAVPDITKQETLSIKGQGLETDAFGSWLFPTPYIGIGLKYQKGDPGLGIGVGLGADGNIVQSGGEFQIVSRFTTYGVFQEKVLTVVGGVTVADDPNNIYSTFNFVDPAKNNAVTSVTKSTTNLTGNGEYATLSGVVEFGNEFLTALVPSSIGTSTGSGGSSTGATAYPDSVWVAAYDKDLNVKRIYGDDRISAATGRHRSQYYSSISDDGKGNVYVFSPSNDASKKPAGVIRINSGTSSFDESYYWNLENEVAKTGKDGKLLFKQMYHVGGDYFILGYLIPGTNPIEGSVPNINALALVNVVDKTFKWVEGLPDFNYYPSFGTPIAEDGKFYVPVKEVDKLPTVYIVDSATGKATKGIEVDTKTISGIGKLRKK
ncbi:DUF4374 domain-containing protein [Sphingobacterium sp. DN00404]|uniref:DUF4374 domain-containing protein n=1 Tax=Sphingobacterium micropteri TaxID=2763501 RepID=A0ABR7YTV1_9SPHI|nr:DUF4374 domain-containing protein [Sphingobacterium micropteri]MBD1434593.1 DUF4374 domain-containing protein [Sphingobacterium micropteri]